MNYDMQAICTNGCSVVLLIILLLNYTRKHNRTSDEFRLFVYMIISNMLQSIIETITIVMDGKLFPGAIPLATGLNAFLFINNIVFSFLWSLYAEKKIGIKWRNGKIRTVVRAVPGALIVIGCIINLFTPVFFRITEENVYQRVGIYLAAYAVTYFYLVWGTAAIYKHRKRVERFTFLPVFTFLLPVVLASVIQYLYPGISLLWAGAAVGLASAYMSLLDESASMDELSGLFSRHYLNQYLSTLPVHAKESTYLVGIMLDVDNFKAINDQHGHLVGDQAIHAVGRILRSAVPSNRMIFRYAGDEFMIIMPVDHPGEVNMVLDRIHEECRKYQESNPAPYQLRMSAGYAIYQAGESPNSFIGRMDERMYEDKKTVKQDQLQKA